MPNMDEFFRSSPAYDHPKLRSWRTKRDRFGDAVVEFKRDRDGLSFRPAMLYVIFRDNAGNEQDTDSEPWDDELNIALIQSHFRAINPSNEIQRFGFMLRPLLRPIEVRYGDGYFNSVLLEIVKSSGLARVPKVASVLKHIHTIRPSDGPSYAGCAERITSVVAQCGGWLVDLGYERGKGNVLANHRPEDDEAAEMVLGAAIANYLDERFSVTNRKLMGW